jgi:hypothetical protein
MVIGSGSGAAAALRLGEAGGRPRPARCFRPGGFAGWLTMKPTLPRQPALAD